MTNVKYLEALSTASMIQRAPALATESPDPRVSNRYKFVRTLDVVDQLRKAGYEPTSVGQDHTRTPDGALYTHHVVRLTHGSYLGDQRRALQVGDLVPQIILRNAHNRSSSFIMSGGMWRLWCANGMATVAGDFADVRVLHSDPAIYDHIIDGTNLIREVTETAVVPQVERMTRLQLADETIREFALAATLLKFGEQRPEHVEPFLEVRREQDEGRALWAVLNRIQENAVRGGYATVDRAGRNITQRGITSAQRDLDFNLGLWSLGSKVLEMA